MSEGLNRASLLGNLGEKPELRFTQGGGAVLNLRLATTTRYCDRDDKWQERTEWHSVVVWGKRAEALEKLLDKGSKVFVEGEIRTSSYEDKDKVKRYKTEIHASSVLLLDGKAKRDDDQGDETGEPPRGNDRGNGGGRDDREPARDSRREERREPARDDRREERSRPWDKGGRS